MYLYLTKGVKTLVIKKAKSMRKVKNFKKRKAKYY